MRFLRLRWIYLSFSLVISAFLLIAIPGLGADKETLDRLEEIIQQQQTQIEPNRRPSSSFNVRLRD